MFYYFIGIMTYDADVHGKFRMHELNAISTIALTALGLFYVVMASIF